MSDTNILLLELIASVATMEEKFSTSLKELSDDNLQLKGDLSKATQKLKDLSTKFEEHECNWKRAGDTFEIVVCRELLHH
jgi:hypothetical protein